MTDSGYLYESSRIPGWRNRIMGYMLNRDQVYISGFTGWGADALPDRWFMSEERLSPVLVPSPLEGEGLG